MGSFKIQTDLSALVELNQVKEPSLGEIIPELHGWLLDTYIGNNFRPHSRPVNSVAGDYKPVVDLHCFVGLNTERLSCVFENATRRSGKGDGLRDEFVNLLSLASYNR